MVIVVMKIDYTDLERVTSRSSGRPQLSAGFIAIAANGQPAFFIEIRASVVAALLG